MRQDAWHRFVAELAHGPHTVEQLLLHHVPDEQGMCRECTTGGTGTRETRWPCSLHALATAAADIAAAEPPPALLTDPAEPPPRSPL